MYNYGPHTFSTKAQVADFIRALVSRSIDRVPLVGADLLFVKELLLHHPDAERKIGAGVIRIWVDAALHRNRGFFLARSDGTSTDFSWTKCLTPKKDFRKDFSQAARAAVKPFTNAFRINFLREHPEACCPIFQMPLTHENTHCDHVAPLTFHALVERFLASYPLVLGPHLFRSGDMLLGCLFADEQVQAAWVTYHNQHAVLRVISAAANLRLPK